MMNAVIIFIAAVVCVVLVLVVLTKYTKLQFVTHARILWRAWSVWLTGLGSLLGAWLQDPDSPRRVVEIWNMLPDDLKHILPVNIATYASYFMIAIGTIAMFVRQPKLSEKRKELEAENHDTTT